MSKYKLGDTLFFIILFIFFIVTLMKFLGLLISNAF